MRWPLLSLERLMPPTKRESQVTNAASGMPALADQPDPLAHLGFFQDDDA